MAILETREIAVRFGGHLAVNDVSLDIAAGAHHGIAATSFPLAGAPPVWGLPGRAALSQWPAAPRALSLFAKDRPVKYRRMPIEVESPELARGCEEGVYEKLDYSKIGNKADFTPAAVHECGIGVFVWSTVMAYNADKIKNAPTPGLTSGT